MGDLPNIWVSESSHFLYICLLACVKKVLSYPLNFKGI